MNVSCDTCAERAAFSSACIEDVPNNRIEVGCERITPDLLPLVDLTQDQIDRIVETVTGGAPNVQDIYPLAPLQEGILFHHLMAQERDPYLLWNQLSFTDRETLDRYVVALNAVIARHDILRTGIIWEGLREPVQVVWRRAPVVVEEVALDAELDIAQQLKDRFGPRRYRMDVRRAPLMRLLVAHDSKQQRWIMMWMFHHLIDDATSFIIMEDEIDAYLNGRGSNLPAPLAFRNYVAQARLGVSREEHEAFFRTMLSDVTEPTAPFGLMDVYGDGSGIGESRLMLEADLAKRLRAKARVLGVSAASLCHVAWGLVVSRCSGQRDPVFGTVLFGRMQGGEGADRVLGLFINTLPVRIRLGEVGVERCVLETHQDLAELLRHEHASLALVQRCSAVPAPAPLFTSALNYRHSDVRMTSPAAIQEGKQRVGEERNNYPVMLLVDDLGSGFSLEAQAVAPLEADRICTMMHRALEQLIEALESDPSLPVGHLDVLPADERHQMLVEWNATEAKYPKDKCIHQLFEAQVKRSPHAMAVVYEDSSLTYEELNARANRLAHYLVAFGVKPDDRVAICVERSLEMIVGLMAILKAGGAYVPLDPEYPTERLGFMLKDSAPGIVLTHQAARPSLEEAIVHSDIKVLTLDLNADASNWSGCPVTDPNPEMLGLTPNHLAYIIYTSGSTGRPKGVMNEHRGVVNRLSAQRAIIYTEPSSVFCQKTTIGFVDSLFETLFPLVLGNVLIIIERRIAQHPRELATALNALNVTHLITVPALAEALILNPDSTRELEVLSSWTISGEALGNELVRRIKSSLPRCRVLNLYGMTEASADATWHAVTLTANNHRCPIGRPIWNTRIYVLDEMGNPVPRGVAGEIYIGGAGVARGYCNRAGLTAERFIASAFVSGDRLYRTGDLGRYLPDGNLELLGRNDFQVKIRGFRIELGEIEARLLSHPEVREAVVLAREDRPGDKRLVAYYTAVDAGKVGAEALRRHLSDVLPDYMVPAAYVRLDELPLMPNGKLDRKALPAPEQTAYSRGEYEAPIGEVESTLTAIWSEVLGIDRVGRHDHFFELGGHSLSAIRVLERMRRAGLQVDVRALFTKPVLSDFAASVSAGSGSVGVPNNRIEVGCERITPDLLPLVDLTQDQIDRIVETVTGGAPNVQDIYPLAPLQEGILFHHLMAQERDPYLLWNQLSFTDRETLDRYVVALNAVIARHDILRTGIIWEGLREPVQVVWRRAPVVVEEVALDAELDIAQQLKDRFGPQRYRMDVRRAPLMRLLVAHDSKQQRWVMMWMFHHLHVDQATLEAIQDEIHAHLIKE